MPSEGRLDLSIVVVSYNVRSYLAECLRSLPHATRGLTWEAFVVDNASRDDSAALVSGEFPSVHLLVNHENLGFSRAVNMALPRTRGRYVLLLNPDAAAPPDTLRRLVAVADRWPAAGVFSPAQRDPASGELRPPLQPFPTWRRAFREHTLAGWLLPRPRPARRGEQETESPTTAGWFGGGALLIRRETLEAIGGLDERFFMWCEDTEYCRRAIRAGWPLVYAPDVVVDHHGGRSHIQERRGWVVFQAFESLLVYLGDEAPRAARVLKPLFKACFLVTVICQLPAHAVKTIGYRLLSRESRAERHRRRLLRAADFLRSFAIRLLRL